MKKYLSVIFILFISINSLYAKDINKFDSLFKKYGDKYGISYVLLKTIALTENNTLNPKVIRHNTNGTKDIGLMQINTLWIKELKHMHLSEKKLKDPNVSVEVAAYILSDLIKNNGYSWDTIGMYHSKTRKYKKIWLKRAKNNIKLIAKYDNKVKIKHEK